uniref:Prefoldin subunit 5 n=1 Tax=Taeniopygia guttata TaxID=59729 RepID=A0A674GIS5_TAEGU
MAQAVSVAELGLPQLELLKGQLEQEVEFLSSSLAQLKVVQTKFVEAKECLNVLHKGNEGEGPPCAAHQLRILVLLLLPQTPSGGL